MQFDGCTEIAHPVSNGAGSEKLNLTAGKNEAGNLVCWC